MGMGFVGAYGAKAATDELQNILKQKFEESQKIKMAELAQAKFAEEQRQADLHNAIQQRQLGQGDQRLGLDERQLTQQGEQFGKRLGLDEGRLGEDRRQFDAMEPTRAASIRHTGAQTADIERKPQAELDQRAFTTGRDKTLQGYEQANIGAQGANQRQLASLRMAGEPGSAGASPQQQHQQNDVTDSLALIDQILKDPALNKSVGPLDSALLNTSREGIGSTLLNAAGGAAKVLTGDPAGVNRFENLHNQLTGKLSLAQAGKLKGQGQISDKERAMLGAAATALSRNMSEADYKTELGKIRQQFERMQVPGASPPHTIRARDPQGGLHEAPAGTALPAGWKLER